jgi:hypothetical protein
MNLVQRHLPDARLISGTVSVWPALSCERASDTASFFISSGARFVSSPNLLCSRKSFRTVWFTICTLNRNTTQYIEPVPSATANVQNSLRTGTSGKSAQTNLNTGKRLMAISFIKFVREFIILNHHFYTASRLCGITLDLPSSVSTNLGPDLDHGNTPF